jgi:hypothetical protein
MDFQAVDFHVVEIHNVSMRHPMTSGSHWSVR